MRVIFFAFVLLLSCAPKQRERINIIRIEINDQNQFLVNGKLISDDNLKNVVLAEKKKIINTGFKIEDIKVIINVAQSAPISHQGRLQTILRQLDLRNIEYMDNREEGV